MPEFIHEIDGRPSGCVLFNEGCTILNLALRLVPEVSTGCSPYAVRILIAAMLRPFVFDLDFRARGFGRCWPLAVVPNA